MMNNFHNSQNKILIIYGRSRSYLDAIRYITNNSSGLMGYELHKILLEKSSYDVNAIVGDVDLLNGELANQRFTTNQELWSILKNSYHQYKWIINLAALNDYKTDHQFTQKIDKSQNNFLTLTLKWNIDIMAELGKLKQPNQYLIGFSAQNDESNLHKAQQKIKAKNLDAVIINSCHAMAQTHNKVTILHKNGELSTSPFTTKQAIAYFIWQHLHTLFNL